MATGTYLNARGVLLSTTSSPTAAHQNFRAAATGTITTAIGGGHTLFADGFDDTFTIYTATDLVVVPAGTPGDDTVVDDASNASYTLAAGVQNLILAGNSQAAIGNTLDNLIIAQGTNTTMNGGGGDDVFVCDSAATTIIDPQNSGSDVIYGFVNGLDHVSLQDATQFTSFAAVQAAMTQIGSDVQLNMGGGQTLTFRNAQLGAFVASDFYLPLNLSGMTMTFDDEFNSLNASPSGVGATWSTTLGHGARTLSANHEAEYYSDSSVGVSPFSVSNGVLTITAAPTNPANNPLGLSYTSGAITTDHSFAQLYGYFEMRAELPAAQGFWPAFWLLPVNGAWPPELDAMEQIGSQPNTDVVSAHSGTSNGQTIVSASVNEGDMSQGFHTYGVYWSPTQIIWYFDGQEIATAATPADMNTPMYMTLNLAVGGTGSWPGTPVSGTSAQMLVDYVRAYAYTGADPVAGAPLGGGTVPNAINNWLPVVDLAVQGVLRQTANQTTTATIAGELTAGTITEGGMISGLISEAQSTTVPGLVTFNQFYGTTPSSAGLDYLANFDVQLAQAGFSLINVWVNLGASFAANGQFGAEYGSMTPVQFVDAAYTSIFGYAPSQAAQNVFTSSVDFYTTFAGSELGAYGAEAGIMMYLANQDPTSTYAIAATNFLEAAALGTATYQTSLVGTYAAPVSAASSLQTSSGITTFAVLDSSANVAASLNSLEGDSKLIAITLTDTGPLSISAVQLSSDAAALAEINSSFSLSVTGTSGADTADLSKISASATINLAGDTVSASAGLNAPSLGFISPVDTVIPGNAAATVQYTVQPTSGIEEIFNFQYGLDQLDLLGVSSGQLEAFNTTFNGQHAIALASSGDLAHGVVLAGLGPNETAADLLANHLTYSNGNAIIA